MYRIGLIGNRRTRIPTARSGMNERMRNRRSSRTPRRQRQSTISTLRREVAREYDAVLEDPNVDIVSICTDFYLKRTLIKKALACGKHVLVDKTIARTVAEAREIVDIVASASNKVLLTYPRDFTDNIAAQEGP